MCVNRVRWVWGEKGAYLSRRDAFNEGGEGDDIGGSHFELVILYEFGVNALGDFSLDLKWGLGIIDVEMSFIPFRPGCT